MHVTNAPVALNLWGSLVTIPKGTPVVLVRGADGIKGDLYAVRDIRLLIDLTGNTHDPHYRYAWVPTDFVTKGGN